MRRATYQTALLVIPDNSLTFIKTVIGSFLLVKIILNIYFKDSLHKNVYLLHNF